MELSIEFFPPKTEEGFTRLKKSAKELSCLQIEYASVTYGAAPVTYAAALNARVTYAAAPVTCAELQ